MKFLPSGERLLQKMKIYIYALCFVLLGISVSAQTRSEKRWIRHLKAAPVSQIDSTLPAQPFDAWLKALVRPEEPVYEVNDCGERNGSPDEQGKEFPLCVNVTAKVSSLRKANLTFIVGTYVVPRNSKRKAQEKPAAKIELFYGEVGPSDPRSKQPTMKVERLSDVLKYVRN